MCVQLKMRLSQVKQWQTGGFSDAEMKIKGWHPRRGGEHVRKTGATTGVTGGTVNGIEETVYEARDKSDGHPRSPHQHANHTRTHPISHS